MDHLPLPIDDFPQSPLEVPFLGSDSLFYDGHGFLTYPARIGLDLDQVMDKGLVDPDALAPALQAWLWFGLLGEILGIGTRTHVAQRVASYKAFVAEKPDGTTVLTTASLRQCIEQVGRQNESRLQDDFYSERYHACLEVATTAIRRLSSSGLCLDQLKAAGQSSSRRPLLVRVILSIQILVETLYAARAMLIPEHGDSLFRQTPEGPGFEIVGRLLLDVGWCEYDIQRLPSSVRLQYYLSFLRPSDFLEGHGDHASCTRDACLQVEPDRQSISPRHTTRRCQCLMVSLQDGVVSQIVEQGNVPVLTFAQADGNTRKLDLLSVRLDSGAAMAAADFVAISHVRRAGLGNADAHSLPYCQLALIQELVNQLRSPDDSNPTPFWLDTMCIPSDRRFHKTSLENIHQVFKRASHVLVLDQALACHAIGSPEDALIRIRYSLWKRRLWTLQEGLMTCPSRLMFRFANATVSLRSLIDSFEATVTFPLISCRRFVGFAVLPHLHEVLQRLSDDIRSISGMSGELTSGLDKMGLRRILRLGYLAHEDYRFIREDWETDWITKVLPLLADLYLDATGSSVQERRRSEDQALARLKKLNHVEI